MTTAAIVGTWYDRPPPGGGTDQIAFTFFADGTYVIADKGTHANDPNGTSGLEAGKYTWNAATGAFTYTNEVNTDGEWGLYDGHVQNGLFLKVANDILTFVGADGAFAISRITSPSITSIVGSWGHAAPNDKQVFTFLADGTYLMASRDGTSSSGDSVGIEQGTYSYNSETHAFSFHNLVNTDGDSGLSDTGKSGTVTVTADAEGIIIIGNEGSFPFTRISPISSTQFGTSLDDTMAGTVNSDTFAGLMGNDTINGSGGIDYALYGVNRDQYTVTKNSSNITVIGRNGVEGTDTLNGVERLKFADYNIAFDLDGNAGKTAKILGAVFGVGSLANKEYVGIGLSLLDGGKSYLDLIQLAIQARLGAQATDYPSVVNLLYTNVIGSTPPAESLALFVGMLTGGMSVAALGQLAADSNYNTDHINLTGLAESGIAYV